MCAMIDGAPSPKIRHRNRYSACSRAGPELPSLISNHDDADTTRHTSRSGTFLSLPSAPPLAGRPLLLPERIACPVQVDHASVCKRVGQHWVRLGTDEARLQRRSSDDSSCHAYAPAVDDCLGLRWTWWKPTRSHQLPNPCPERRLGHSQGDGQERGHR